MERKVNKGEYLSPQCEVIEMQMTEIIAASGDYTVSNPWEDNEEQNW